jgi:hypothetical protein
MEGDIISLTPVSRPAADPGGDVACDTTIATPDAQAAMRRDLAEHLVPPVREISGGIQATFRRAGWDAVMRYIELESRCCSFLDLSARRQHDRVILTVTGRPEAQPFIRTLFSAR